MDELLKSVKAHLYDRTASPLLGAFILSWTVWNYRTIVILLSDEKLDSKFKAIDIEFSNYQLFDVSINAVFANGILIPAVFALFYIYIYPLISEPVYKYSLEKRRRLKELKQESEDLTLLSEKESREIYKELALAKTNHDSEIENYSKQISNSTKIISDLQSELDALKTKLPKPDVRSTDDTSMDGDINVDGADYAYILLSPINSDTLSQYSRFKYPGLAISSSWQKRILEDLNTAKYRHIEDIDAAVSRATLAVETYKRENPGTFKFSTDYISKSLGFVDREFRDKHSWSTESLEAFTQYESLVE